VKGRAGSPYAVKDYYNVNPDLANDPAQRLEEFEALVARTHEAGMKVIIDIVPNHVARKYESLSLPEGEENFGASDDTSVEYDRDNNFYYIVDESFAVPEAKNGYQPLGGDAHPLADNQFAEIPAKWTGNGSRMAQPDANDWYETVKVNYGVRPDGSYDFPSLPDGFDTKPVADHAAFWADKDVPDSWKKFHSIVHYWLDKGVDGFRYDMAEMVPVEFWSYLNSSIKVKNPDAFLLAEVYQPHLYRDYLHLGKMDYLYDKVEFYDSLKLVMQQKGSTAELHNIIGRLSDIDQHMLHFLENHDEQRIASPDFAGDAEIGRPALVASAFSNSAPIMHYFAQDVGEDGSEETGFGDPTRTSIFDYVGVPAHQRWMNSGKFDGGMLTESEASLRAYYIDVLNLAASHPAVNGDYQPVPSDDDVYAFVRSHEGKNLLVVSNFNQEAAKTIDVSAFIADTSKVKVLLSDAKNTQATNALTLPPLGSAVWEF
jgi:glycosidase